MKLWLNARCFVTAVGKVDIVSMNLELERKVSSGCRMAKPTLSEKTTYNYTIR